MQNQTQIFVRDFKIDALVGIYPEDEVNLTPLSISVDAIFTDYKVNSDHIDSTMSYALIVDEIYLMAKKHFHLVEKMAEHLADFCLSNSRVASVRVRVEKTKMFSEGFVGTEITRIKS